MPTTRRPRQRARRAGDMEIWEFLLNPWHADYFHDLPGLGEARVREVWAADRDAILAEFARRYSGTAKWEQAEGKPLGWHLFEVG